MSFSKASPAYALYILLLLLAINALSYADRHVFSVLIPSIKAEFGATDSLLGLIGGPGFIVSYVLFSMPLARLADRWSRRGVLALSATLWSAATAACGAAGSLVQLGMARLVVGVGEAGGLPPGQSMLSDLYDERRRSGAMGILSSATYFGVVLGLTGGAAVGALWGWRAAFYTLALPGFPLALLLWATGPRRAKAAAPAPPSSENGKDRESMIVAMRRFWAIPSLRLLAVAVGTFNIFGYAAAVWKPAFFMRSHGMTMVEAGAWLGIGAAIGGITGSMLSGFIVDTLRQRGEVWQLRVPAIAFLLAFPLFMIMYLLPGGAAVTIGGFRVPGVALLSVLTGMMSAMWAGPSFGAAARLVAPDQRAQAVAMLVVIINVIGSALGPVLGGGVSDLLMGQFGQESLRMALMAMSILTVAGGLLFWRAAVHYPRDLLARQAG
ncbi:MFS family permease [Sphingobium sp. OAS761]|uniref:MFS transporter n=1 Tax=Sphingobium sp. OAS761 TaxID=2817901 RepID=UPI0020A1E329|nr:MFS transporter [Sphingobium sp. OAS761]MCP1471767.1 MFS family permease [Sphingobium sp. OAS761]